MVLNLKEMDVVEWYTISGQQVPGIGLVGSVLHREVHVDVPAHGVNHVTDWLGRGEACLVLVRRPQHPHGLMTLVLPREQPPASAPLTTLVL